MISVDASQTLADLEKYLEETTRKLEHMVRGFAYTISEYAIANTPLGNAEQYMKLYERRQNSLGLQPTEGFARGSWQVSTSGQFNIQQLYTVNSGSAALALIKTDLSSYKLGQDVYVGNKGWYIRLLENNYSSQTNEMGIMKPTLDSLMKVYQADLKRLFNEG